MLTVAEKPSWTAASQMQLVTHYNTAVPCTSYTVCTVEIFIWYISHIQNLNIPVVCWDGKCHDFILLTHLWLSHPYATSWWGMLRSVWCWITSPVSDARTWLRWRRHWAVQSASGAAGPRLKCEVICFCPERVMLQGTHGLFYCWEVIMRPPSASRPFLRTCFEDVRYIETSATRIM